MRIALAELEHHQLCEASPPEGPRAQSDTWQLLGLRVCALLHLRTGDEGRALTILKSQLRASATVHNFISGFALDAWLPPPVSPVAPPRFSLEQMLEVLEDALQSAPQHRLASEGHLLKWQLRRMLGFGRPRCVSVF